MTNYNYLLAGLFVDPECPGKKELVSCWFPDDNGYHECDTESDLTIMYAFLKKKYSSNHCNYHRNTYGIVGDFGYGQYGYDGRKLWVENKCGGIFEVCYAGNCVTPIGAVKHFSRKIAIIYLSISLNMCFVCSKEPSY